MLGFPLGKCLLLPSNATAHSCCRCTLEYLLGSVLRLVYQYFPLYFELRLMLLWDSIPVSSGCFPGTWLPRRVGIVGAFLREF